MIFNRLAEKGFTTEQVLDFTPHVTRIVLADESSIQKSDDLARENAIRANLKLYEGRRLLTMKYQKELDEHLEKTAQERHKLVERMKQMIVAEISNG